MSTASSENTLNEPFGDYVLVRRIGEGGMAVTYEARERVGDVAERVVCIKQILPQFASDPKFRQMFHDEVRVSSLLSHRNICRIFRAGQVDDTLYMAMEYVDGLAVADLYELVRSRGNAFPVDHALYIMSEVLEGLHAAHTQVDTEGNALNLVHRDVSPQNVLVSRTGDVKVIDFGVAKAASNMSKTRTGAVKGKLLYLSPEQLQSERLDGRSDLFAAGLVLYELLTDTHPFAGADEHSTIYNFITRSIEPPSTLSSRIPTVVDAPIMKALERDRGGRFNSAARMARALTDVLYTVSPGYRPYHFNDFIAWALDPDSGEMPTGPGSSHPMSQTGEGFSSPTTDAALADTGAWSSAPPAGGSADTIKTPAVAPDYDVPPTAHQPAPKPKPPRRTAVETAPESGENEASNVSEGTDATPSTSQSSNRTLVAAIVVLSVLLIAAVATGAVLYFGQSDDTSEKLEGSASSDDGPAGDGNEDGAQDDDGENESDDGESASDDDDGESDDGESASADDDGESDGESDDGESDDGDADKTTAATAPSLPDDQSDEADATDDAPGPADTTDGSAWGYDDEDDDEDDAGAWGGSGTTGSDDGDDSGDEDTPVDDDASDSSGGMLESWEDATTIEDIHRLELPTQQAESLKMSRQYMSGLANTRFETYMRIALLTSVDQQAFIPLMKILCADVEKRPWTSAELKVMNTYFGGQNPCTSIPL